MTRRPRSRLFLDRVRCCLRWNKYKFKESFRDGGFPFLMSVIMMVIVFLGRVLLAVYRNEEGALIPFYVMMVAIVGVFLFSVTVDCVRWRENEFVKVATSRCRHGSEANAELEKLLVDQTHSDLIENIDWYGSRYDYEYTEAEKHFKDGNALKLAKWMDSHQSLISVKIVYKGITSIGAQAIVKAISTMPDLESFDISGNTIGDETVKSIGDLLLTNTSLTDLNVSDCCFGDVGCCGIGLGLRYSYTLKSLDISENNNITDYGFNYIAQSISLNKSLSSLFVNRNNSEVQTSVNSGLLQIAKSISSINTSITKLSLASAHLAVPGANAIAQILLTHPAIISIHFCENEIGSKGAMIIADALKYNRTLRILSLQDNNIEEDGMDAIGYAIRFHPSLTALYLGGSSNAIDDECAKVFIESLETSNYNTLSRLSFTRILSLSTYFSKPLISFVNELYGGSTLISAELNARLSKLIEYNAAKNEDIVSDRNRVISTFFNKPTGFLNSTADSLSSYDLEKFVMTLQSINLKLPPSKQCQRLSFINCSFADIGNHNVSHNLFWKGSPLSQSVTDITVVGYDIQDPDFTFLSHFSNLTRLTFTIT